MTGADASGPTPGGHLASRSVLVNTSMRTVPAVGLIEAWTDSIVIPSSQSGLSWRTGSASVFHPAPSRTHAICSAVRAHSRSGGYLKTAMVPVNCFNRSIASCWFSNQRGDSSRSSLISFEIGLRCRLFRLGSAVKCQCGPFICLGNFRVSAFPGFCQM